MDMCTVAFTVNEIEGIIHFIIFFHYVFMNCVWNSNFSIKLIVLILLLRT